MGWSSGTGLFASLIESAVKNVPDDDDRKQLYLDMLEAFESHDWDNLDEVVGLDEVYDDIYNDRYPSDEEDENEDEE